MDWKAHVVFGAFISLIVFYFLLGLQNTAQIASLVFLSAISALAPDLDHEMSKGKKLADAIAVILALFFAIAINSVIAFFAILGIYFIGFSIIKPKHRGITHTLIAGAVFSALIFVFTNSNFAIAGAIGYFSHLIGDRHLKIA